MIIEEQNEENLENQSSILVFNGFGFLTLVFSQLVLVRVLEWKGLAYICC